MARLSPPLAAALLILALPLTASAQTTLQVGDIAMTGYRADTPDGFSFLLLADVEAGTEIHFTDNGWFAAGGFRANEAVETWTAGADMSAGTEVFVTTLLGLSTSGDSLLAYQGDAATPTFIAGIFADTSDDASTGWSLDATNSNSSARPPGLSAGDSISLDAAGGPGEVDNAAYNCSVESGTVAELRAALTDPTRWSGGDGGGDATVPPGCNFSITPDNDPCGDGSCDAGETVLTCAADCAVLSDFEDGTTQGWISGGSHPSPPSLDADEGITGAGDTALRVIADGSGAGGKLVFFNTTTFTGDFTARGVTKLYAHVRNLGGTSLGLYAVFDGAGGRWATRDRVLVPALANWMIAEFDVAPADLVSVGGADVNATLAAVSTVRILHQGTPSYRGTPVSALVLFDNISTAPLAPVCGDAVCNGDENAGSCAPDCGRISDFDDGTTQGWGTGGSNPTPPAQVADAGITGAGDGGLHVQADGSGDGGKLVFFNSTTFAGDYTGVDFIYAHARNVGPGELQLRVALDGAGGRFASTAGAVLPADGNWHTVQMAVGEAGLTSAGGFDAAATRAVVSLVRIMHALSPDYRGTPTVAEVFFDNIGTSAPAPICGDGDLDAGEICDDGNRADGDGCNQFCEEEVCGDNIVQAGLGEVCDGSVPAGQDCASLGFDGGDSVCSDACAIDTSGCFVCGDGTCDAAEDQQGCPADCAILTDFQDGTTAGWGSGNNHPDPPANAADSGPEGFGDSALRAVAVGSGSGGRLVFFETRDWLGDLPGRGIAQLHMHARNVGAVDLVLRAVLDGPGGRFVTSAGAALPADGNYRILSFDISAGGLVAGSTGTDLAATLGGVTELRMIHNDAATDSGPLLVTELHVDNVSSLPLAAICGDGADNRVEEGCDDGNLVDGDGCAANCVTEFCGDGAVQGGIGEACEDGVVLTETCETLGFDGGVLGCTDCAFDTGDCFGCGDGVCNVGENQVACSVDCALTQDFQDGTTQGWRSGGSHPAPPAAVIDMGPTGRDDFALQMNADGSGPGGKLVSFETSAWTGDFTSRGWTQIHAHLRVEGNADLQMRVAVDGPGGRFASAPVPVTAGGGWHSARFDIDAASLSSAGGNDAAATLAAVSTLRLLHATGASWRGSAVTATLFADNISTLPLDPFCGDGDVDGDEICDDGNRVDDDGCTQDCAAETCGDGIIQVGLGEVCDDGGDNSDFVPDACRSTCLLPACGDGVPDSNEACDEGEFNSDSVPDACRTNCERASCGDGVVDADEACDDGEDNSDTVASACRTNCEAARCGDGVLDLDEECDDGVDNSDSVPDACRTSCELAGCGDGVQDGDEACDDGDDNSDLNPNACRTSCQLPSCGDGVIDADEGCDDAGDNSDTAADACRTSCEPAGCGDDVVDSGEGCDDGGDNSDLNPNACRTNCQPARCGDNVIDAGETCDDGENNSDTVPGACRTRCVLASCGDGILDVGEDCDDGEDNSDSEPNACRTSCVEAFCGDGVIDAGEGCDAGEDNSDSEVDACRTSCEPAGCGDGVIDAGETCDDGEDNSNTEPNACRGSCQPAGCGDAVVDTGEGCDAGENNSDSEPDACRTSCELAGCGDGVVDDGEACDGGEDNSDSEADACRTSCALADCGDGVVDDGEACDDGDGNSDVDADACRTNCSLASCGDGVVDDGEACDAGEDNSDVDADACRSTCVAAFCGDGVQDAAETCDDGENNSDVISDACRSDCSAPSCGDGVVDEGEGCDDGEANADAPDTCRSNCAAPVCGDGIVDMGEGCDAGEDNSDTEVDACRTSCAPAGCGDGIVDADEACDAGENNSNSEVDACRTTCVLAFCGDGVVDSGEVCDAGDDNSDSDADACRTSCVVASCGDGVVDAGEGCDAGENNSDTEVDACRTSCALASCGDGVVDDGEGCDDGESNSDTEANACRVNCVLAFCGDGVVDDGEGCDGGEGCTANCQLPGEAASASASAADNGPVSGAAGATGLNAATLSVTAGAGEAIVLRSLAVSVSGTGNDATDIANITVRDAAGIVIGSGSFSSDNGEVAIDLDPAPQLDAEATAGLSVSYDFAATLAPPPNPAGAGGTGVVLLALAIAALLWRRRGSLSPLLPVLLLCLALFGGAMACSDSSDPEPALERSYVSQVTAIEAVGADSGAEIEVRGLPLAGTTITLR